MTYMDMFKDYLDSEGVPYTSYENGFIKVSYNTENAPTVTVFAAFSEVGGLLARCTGFINFGANRAAALEVCNEMNNEHTTVSFVLDEDGDISCVAHLRVEEDTCCEYAEFAMDTVANAVDEAYPAFARARFA